MPYLRVSFSGLAHGFLVAVLPLKIKLTNGQGVNKMVSVLPTSLSINGIASWLLYGMFAVGGYILIKNTVAPAVQDLVEKEA